MSTPKYLLGIVIGKAPEKIWPETQKAFEQFLSFMAKGEKRPLTLTTRKIADSVYSLPKDIKKKLDVTDFMNSKQWKSLTKEYLTYQLIAAEVEDQFGIIYQIPWISGGQSPASAHIGLWTLMPAPEQIVECEKIIADAIRQAMQNHALQGFMTNWDWIPKINMWHRTPYEYACFGSNTGVNPKVIEATEWCTSHLRGMGNKTWLGADLLERIGGKAALEKLPKVSYRAPYVELDLNTDAEFDQAEAVLEPILPSAAELYKID
jgi:hypothetical protein